MRVMRPPPGGLPLFRIILDKGLPPSIVNATSPMEANPEFSSTDLFPNRKGLRQTEQRKAVLETLLSQADHPTAVDLFMRVKGRIPSISLATVYNCLETLTDSGVVRIVNHEREPSRFCANLAEHAHLFCTACNCVTDLPLRKSVPAHQIWNIPEGARIADQNVAFRGLCARCAADHGDTASSQKKPAIEPSSL